MINTHWVFYNFMSIILPYLLTIVEGLEDGKQGRKKRTINEQDKNVTVKIMAL